MQNCYYFLLLFVACNVNTSADEVTNDLVKIYKSDYQLKMNSNLGIKQAQEVIISRKTRKEGFPPMVFEH